MSHQFPEFNGEVGVWALYNYNYGPATVDYFSSDATKVIIKMQNGDKIMFWPKNKTVDEAIAWWDGTTKEMNQ